MFSVVVRIMLLKCAWCIIWVYLNACEQLRGCLKVAFPGDLCLMAVSLGLLQALSECNLKGLFYLKSVKGYCCCRNINCITGKRYSSKDAVYSSSKSEKASEYISVCFCNVYLIYLYREGTTWSLACIRKPEFLAKGSGFLSICQTSKSLATSTTFLLKCH